MLDHLDTGERSCDRHPDKNVDGSLVAALEGLDLPGIEDKAEQCLLAASRRLAERLDMRRVAGGIGEPDRIGKDISQVPPLPLVERRLNDAL